MKTFHFITLAILAGFLFAGCQPSSDDKSDSGNETQTVSLKVTGMT